MINIEYYISKQVMSLGIAVMILGLNCGKANAEYGNVNDKNGNTVRVQILGNQVYNPSTGQDMGTVRPDGSFQSNSPNQFNNRTPVYGDDDAKRRAIQIQQQNRTAAEQTVESEHFIDERITNVDDYIKQAGKYMEAGNINVAEAMYRNILNKKYRLSKKQQIELYFCLGQIYETTGRLSDAWRNYTFAYNAGYKQIKYKIDKLEKTLK